METAFELEDDVFFADISKQLSLLIMDDDEKSLVSHSPSVYLQAITQSIYPPRQQASFPSYDHQINCRRDSKGTGVFIPRTRTNSTKQRRITTSGNNFQRSSSDQKSITGHPQMACNNSISPYNDSSNLRRF